MRMHVQKHKFHKDQPISVLTEVKTLHVKTVAGYLMVICQCFSLVAWQIHKLGCPAADLSTELVHKQFITFPLFSS